ncbi:MAG: ankyrin repeat domain-containing protein, partial [Ottowia sp.]|nr:ankyrin repeat domain-containing protein [Ottowia sp.]
MEHDNAASALLLAVAEVGDMDIVRGALEAGADANACGLHGITDGVSALMLASRGGHFPVVQFLAAAGADIHAADGAGETALLRAASGGFIDIVRFLHEKGASADDVG